MTARQPVGGPERGSATVLVLGLVAVLALVAAVGTALAGVGVARHRAASAADLAALAAASRAVEGGLAACDAARTTARASGAVLARCALDGRTAEVVAVVQPPGPLGALGQAQSRARAGPAG